MADNSPDFSNLLLIAATGSNVGKTTLATAILQNLNKDLNIIALKVSPHFHQIDGNRKILEQTENYMIVEEQDEISGKDTSKLIRAGAKKAYLVHGKEEYVIEAFLKLFSTFPANQPVICESAGLAYHIKAGMLILLKREGYDKKNIFELLKNKADLIITSDGHQFDMDISGIGFADGKWIY
jgi:cobyrinic acid a,c-diamide synthase